MKGQVDSQMWEGQSLKFVVVITPMEYLRDQMKFDFLMLAVAVGMWAGGDLFAAVLMVLLRQHLMEMLLTRFLDLKLLMRKCLELVFVTEMLVDLLVFQLILVDWVDFVLEEK